MNEVRTRFDDACAGGREGPGKADRSRTARSGQSSRGLKAQRCNTQEASSLRALRRIADNCGTVIGASRAYLYRPGVIQSAAGFENQCAIDRESRR